VAKRLTLRVVTSFRRRVIGRLDDLTVQLLWFSAGDPIMEHAERFRLAKLILTTTCAELPITVRKVKYLFRKALEWVVLTSGKVPMRMLFFFKQLSVEWSADTMEVVRLGR